MDVSIIENDSGKVIASYQINLNGLNYAPTEEEYYSEAWKCAVDDKVVDSEDRNKYSLNISKG